jgi:hypothetical protein
MGGWGGGGVGAPRVGGADESVGADLSAVERMAPKRRKAWGGSGVGWQWGGVGGVGVRVQWE